MTEEHTNAGNVSSTYDDLNFSPGARAELFCSIFTLAFRIIVLFSGFIFYPLGHKASFFPAVTARCCCSRKGHPGGTKRFLHSHPHPHPFSSWLIYPFTCNKIKKSKTLNFPLSLSQDLPTDLPELAPFRSLTGSHPSFLTAL